MARVRASAGYDTGIASSSSERLREQFEVLAARWQSETRRLSSLTEIVLNSNYQRIIGLGQGAVPLILERLSEQPAHWFWALSAITGENPIAPADAGDLRRMRQAWLDWGRGRGLLA